jgi:hypothetical protein
MRYAIECGYNKQQALDSISMGAEEIRRIAEYSQDDTGNGVEHDTSDDTTSANSVELMCDQRASEWEIVVLFEVVNFLEVLDVNVFVNKYTRRHGPAYRSKDLEANMYESFNHALTKVACPPS